MNRAVIRCFLLVTIFVVCVSDIHFVNIQSRVVHEADACHGENSGPAMPCSSVASQVGESGNPEGSLTFLTAAIYGKAFPQSVCMTLTS